MGGHGGHIDVKFLRAVALMIGGILGVGVFGLPFVFVRSGLPVGLLLLVTFGLLLLLLNLMYGEIVIRTEGKHRLGGYVKAYLGSGWGTAASVAMAAAVVGALVAFLIVGSTFLYSLFSPTFGGPEQLYALLLALSVAAASSRGTGLASRIEGPVVGAMLLLFTLITLVALPQADIKNISGEAVWAAIPFGAVLFALSGGGIIPNMREVLGARARRQLPLAITAGMAVVVLIEAAFSSVVVAVTGAATTPIAFEGLIPLLGTSFALVTLVLGSIVVFSISLTNVIQLADVLRVDHGFRPRHAWLLATGTAIILYLLGARNFIGVIGFSGAVFGGLIGLFIVATYEKMKRDTVCRHAHCLEVPTWASVVVGLVFLGAMMSELSHSL